MKIKQPRSQCLHSSTLISFLLQPNIPHQQSSAVDQPNSTTINNSLNFVCLTPSDSNAMLTVAMSNNSLQQQIIENRV